MKAFWDERYALDEYVYGTAPNQFFKGHLDNLKSGHLLLPAEGEGRNAVYAAAKGWKVDAFDISEEGRKKALRLAKRENVEMNYEISDYLAFTSPRKYDLIGLFYNHTDPETRFAFHSKLKSLLNEGAKIILEAFSKDQLGKSSGGPKQRDMLFDKEELRVDFEGLKIVYLEEQAVMLEEGRFHSGEASVVRMVAANE
jgi:hypothetical protein